MASNLRVDTILPSTGTSLGIGTASGTTTVTGNLVASSVSVTGALGIGGTLTYEDVTNIDSVGVITARSGIDAASNLLLKTGGSERVRINSTGNMGLGVSDPNVLNEPSKFQELTLGGKSEGAAIHLKDDNGNVQGGLFTSDNTGAMIVRTITNHYMQFRTNNTERLRIGESGQIGIGGANYGTSGQVLTSQGSGSAVQWATPSAGGAAAGNFFRARMSGGYNTSNNTQGQIVFQSEDFDIGGRYNTGNGLFTPNIAGYYFVDASLQFSNSTGNYNFRSSIFKNNSEYCFNQMWNDGSNGENHNKVSSIVYLNGSSDYIAIKAWQQSGGNLTVNASNSSYFSAFFLRAS